MNMEKIDSIFEIFELFGNLKHPPKKQTEKEKSGGAFKKIFEDCKKVLEEKENDKKVEK